MSKMSGNHHVKISWCRVSGFPILFFFSLVLIFFCILSFFLFSILLSFLFYLCFFLSASSHIETSLIASSGPLWQGILIDAYQSSVASYRVEPISVSTNKRAYAHSSRSMPIAGKGKYNPWHAENVCPCFSVHWNVLAAQHGEKKRPQAAGSRYTCAQTQINNIW